MILSTENDNFLKKIVSGNPGTGEKILVAAADTVRIGSYGVEEESNLKFWEISAIEEPYICVTENGCAVSLGVP